MANIRSTICNTLSRIILGSIVVSPIVFADKTHASEFCSNIEALTSNARSNFPQADSNALAGTASRLFPDAAKCTMARSLAGAKTYHCAWTFPYRDPAADAAFDFFNQMMRGCRHDDVEPVEEHGVNHPDSFRQSRYVMDGAVVSLSSKDKSALQKTYVFVGFQGTVSD